MFSPEIKTPTEASPFSVSSSGPEDQEKRASKARLLLNLIKNGTIPSLPDRFIQDLAQLAENEISDKQLDFGGALNSLNLHIQEHITTPVMTSGSPKEQSASLSLEISMADQKPAARTKPQTLSNNESSPDQLSDQHPAVICQQIKQFSEKDVHAQLKCLPGRTARQVAFLVWQRS